MNAKKLKIKGVSYNLVDNDVDSLKSLENAGKVIAIDSAGTGLSAVSVQGSLPSASESGQVLKSTNTSGGIEWGSVSWGNITGTLSSQSDLNTALSGKADSATTLSGYGITDAYTKSEVDTKVSSVYKYQGSCTWAELIVKTDQEVGYVWNVTDAHDNIPAGTNHACKVAKTAGASSWDPLGGTVDFSNYYNKTETDNLLTAKANLSYVNTELAKKLDLQTAIDDYATYDYVDPIFSTKANLSYVNTELDKKLNLTGGTVASLEVTGTLKADVSGNCSGSSSSCTGNSATASTLVDLTATVAELNYCDGVTSNIQTQLTARANKPVGYTFSTWSGSASAGYTCTITLTDPLSSDLNCIAQVFRKDSTGKYTSIADTAVTIDSTTSITLSSPFSYEGKVVVIKA